MNLRSPVTGATLTPAGHALQAPGERWPVIDGIPFLRADRRDLAAAALARLDADDAEGALVLLLGDQDGWARTPPPAEESRRRLVRERERLNFREAMELLALGGVAAYFAHRWSDPTFLSGLALAQAHWRGRPRVLELACGAGHFLRAFEPHASGVTGGDLVFAKLWLARHYVAPTATLVCFDAAAPWPFPPGAADLLFCHDAFYFLPDKTVVAASMLETADAILVGHTHNALVDNYSAGAPLDPAGYAALFPAPVMFDDDELRASLLERRTPRAATPPALAGAAAVALAVRTGAPRMADGPLTAPASGTKLRRNPLYADGAVVWPSPRYEAEYASRATYPAVTDAPAHAVAGASAAVEAWARQRVLLDLPDRW